MSWFSKCKRCGKRPRKCRCAAKRGARIRRPDEADELTEAPKRGPVTDTYSPNSWRSTRKEVEDAVEEVRKKHRPSRK